MTRDMKLTLGILIEILEDWMNQNLNENRIVAQFIADDNVITIPVSAAYYQVDPQNLWLLTRRRDEEDLYDDDGVLLNDESPCGIYKQVREAESENLGNQTEVGIEIWFTDGEDDIQYRVACDEYEIIDRSLVVKHFIKRDVDENYFEFRRFLSEQY